MTPNEREKHRDRLRYGLIAAVMRESNGFDQGRDAIMAYVDAAIAAHVAEHHAPADWSLRCARCGHEGRPSEVMRYADGVVTCPACAPAPQAPASGPEPVARRCSCCYRVYNRAATYCPSLCPRSTLDPLYDQRAVDAAHEQGRREGQQSPRVLLPDGNLATEAEALLDCRSRLATTKRKLNDALATSAMWQREVSGRDADIDALRAELAAARAQLDESVALLRRAVHATSQSWWPEGVNWLIDHDDAAAKERP